MKYIIFNDRITTESMNNLMKEITEDTTIYFNSEGGELPAADSFIDFTRRCDKKICIIACWRVSSMGIDVFLFSNSEKKVLDSAYGMIHVLSTETSTIEGRKNSFNYQYEKLSEEYLNNRRWNQYNELGLSADLYARYINGEDIYIPVKTLREMADKAEKKYCWHVPKTQEGERDVSSTPSKI